MRAAGLGWDGFLLYLERRAVSHLLVLAVLVAGVSVGALASGALADSQKAELSSHLGVYLHGLGNDLTTLDSGAMLRQSALTYLKLSIILWALGATVVAAPLVLGVVFVRGFVIGFAVAFLAQELGWQGVAFATVAVWPQNILAVPGIVGAGAAALSYAGQVASRRMRRKRTGDGEDLLTYTVITAVFVAVLGISGLVEAYISPALMRLVARLLG
ncbi:MAG: stage II sporulation protein M [Bacillota bacterium]